MKVGDLVKFCPKSPWRVNQTWERYIKRIKKRIGDQPGIIVSKSSMSLSIMFGNDVVVIHEKFLEKYYEEDE